MTRIVEIDYWKLIPGSKEHSEELVRNFAKFASKGLGSRYSNDIL